MSGVGDELGEPRVIEEDDGVAGVEAEEIDVAYEIRVDGRRFRHDGRGG